jgi:hypothetical protein
MGVRIITKYGRVLDVPASHARLLVQLRRAEVLAPEPAPVATEPDKAQAPVARRRHRRRDVVPQERVVMEAESVKEEEAAQEVQAPAPAPVTWPLLSDDVPADTEDESKE